MTMATWARERVLVTAVSELITHLKDLQTAYEAYIENGDEDWPEDTPGTHELIDNCDDAMEVYVEARNAVAQLTQNRGALPLVAFRLIAPNEDGTFPPLGKAE